MATAKSAKAAAPDKGAAARAEGQGEELTVEFRGMEIKLPPKLRESVIWRFGILRQDDLQGAARLVQSVIGAEQFGLVLDKLDEDEVFVDDTADVSPMAKLLNEALAAYGLEPGESPASNGS